MNRNKYIEKNLCITLVIYQESEFLRTKDWQDISYWIMKS